jgi:exopolysaccharide biosynthesis polyprenyl glycosylphosphotransferase
MYVGGLGAAAGGTASLVGEIPAIADTTLRPAPRKFGEFGARAASGAARGLRSGPSGGGYGGPGLAGRHRRSVVPYIVLIDLVAAAVAVSVAYGTRFGFAASGQVVIDLLTAVALPALWVGVAAANGAYDHRFLGVGTTEFSRLGRTFTYVLALTAFASYAAQLNIARGFVVVALPLALLLSWAGHFVARVKLQQLRRAGRAMDRVLVVGAAASLQPMAAAMRRDPAAGLHVIGACLPADEAADPAIRRAFAELGVPVVGDIDRVRSSVLHCDARSVAVVAGDVGTRTLRSLSWSLEDTGADLIVSSGLTEVVGQRVHVQSVAGAPLLRVDTPRYGGMRHVLKALFDRVTAGLALVVLSPLLITIALLVRCTSRGSALYLQERVGRNGKSFRMVKFRSMRVGADDDLQSLRDHNESDGVLFKMRQDPRVTPVGRWLRRFSLDELPQLLNVFTGSMSLVGPRPPLPSEVAHYEGDVRRRLLVKPGLTGLWQVSGRSDLSWEDSVRLDLHYVENWSFSLDLMLLFKTARAVVKATGAY